MIICLDLFCLDKGGREKDRTKWMGRGVSPLAQQWLQVVGRLQICFMRISVGGLDVREDEERNHPPMLY